MRQCSSSWSGPKPCSPRSRSPPPTCTVVARICTQLDGIPLALELAAARLSALGVADLAARLDQRFRLLTGGGRGTLPRQQTLEADGDVEL